MVPKFSSSLPEFIMGYILPFTVAMVWTTLPIDRFVPQ